MPMSKTVRGLQGLLLLIALGVCGAAQAFVVSIDPGARAVYLRVGNGVFSAANYSNGGTPGSGGPINLVSVSVPAAVLGNGTNLAMTTNATSGISNYDGFAFCDVPAEIYVGGFYRRNGTGTATLTATVPANLTTTAGDAIPFSQISWTSSGNGDTGAQPILAGTFAGGSTQTLASFPVNSWRESCHSFSYGNDAVVAAGTYTGRVVYTLSAP